MKICCSTQRCSKQMKMWPQEHQIRGNTGAVKEDVMFCKRFIIKKSSKQCSPPMLPICCVHFTIYSWLKHSKTHIYLTKVYVRRPYKNKAHPSFHFIHCQRRFSDLCHRTTARSTHSGLMAGCKNSTLTNIPFPKFPCSPFKVTGTSQLGNICRL